MARGKTEIYGQWLGGSLVMADQGQSTGNRFWVHSGTGTDATGWGYSPTAPTATIDYAIGLCTADKGDVIYVLPGHVETIAATNGFDADVAGIKIIGLGWGEIRPTLNFTQTASQVNVGADSVWIENIRFVAGVSAIVAGLQVEAVDDFVLKDCEFYWGDTTGWDFILAVELETPCRRALIQGCKFLGEPAVAGCASAIKFTGGASNNCTVRDCEFVGDYDPAAVNVPTALQQHFMFLNNRVYTTNAGEPYLETFAGTTGIIYGTIGCASAATIADNAVANAMVHVENYVGNTTGTIPIIKGAGGTPALDAD